MELKAVVLQRTELGEMRIRADIEVETQYGKPTISRGMEGILPIDQLNAWEAKWEELVTWLNESGIPPA